MDPGPSGAARQERTAVRLTVQKAEALEKRSALRSPFRSPRWYAAVSVDGSHARITKQVKAADPVWDETFEFELEESSIVKVEVVDASGSNAAHEPFAEVSLRPSLLVQKERVIEHGFYLSKPGAEAGLRMGIVHLHIEYYTYKDNASSKSRPSQPPPAISRSSRPSLPPRPLSARPTKEALLSLEQVRVTAVAAEGRVGGLSISDKKSAAISAASGVTSLASNAEVDSTFGTVCKYVETLVKVGGALAEIHPWASLAWSVLSVIPKNLVIEMQRDIKVHQLWVVAADMLDFLDNAEMALRDLQENFQVKTVAAMMQQIYDCALFVREYAGKGFLKRALRDTLSDSSDQAIAQYTFAFQQLKSQFSSRLELSSVKIFADVRLGVVNVGDTLDVLTTLERTKILEALPGTSLLQVRCDERRTCLPGTRTELLEALDAWVAAAAPDTPNVFCLSGQSGTGKSTVANTIAAQFSEIGRLGASFCFRPASGLNTEENASVFAGNIAYQLAHFSKQYRATLLDVLDRRGRMNIHPLRDQLEHYIAAPLASLEFSGPLVLVFDGAEAGLDEHDGVLGALVDACAHLPPFVKLLVTSRESPDVPEGLLARVGEYSLDDPVVAHEDIVRYTQDRLVGVARKHGVAQTWLGTVDVRALAQCAGSLFIWATVACNYLRRARDLNEALARVLSVGESGAAEQTLGQLYELAAENSTGDLGASAMSSERSLTPMTSPSSQRPQASPLLSPPLSHTSSVSSMSGSLITESSVTDTEVSLVGLHISPVTVSHTRVPSEAVARRVTPQSVPGNMRRFISRKVELWGPLDHKGSAPVPFLRAWHFDDHHDHFYSTDPAELHLANAVHRYRIEGTIGLIYPSQAPGTAPLFRLRNPHTWDHFYTTDETERRGLLAIYKDEGIAGYVYQKDAPGSVPLYRLYCGDRGDHFYTASESEKEAAVKHCLYQDEGIAAWILPNSEPPQLVPFHRCYSNSLRNHFYTANGEEARITAREAHWQAEDDVGCIYPTEAPGTVPLFRMYHRGSSDHFYTTDGGEYSSVRRGGAYYPEGIAGYVYSTMIPGAVPLYRLYSGPRTDHFYTTSTMERDLYISQLGYTDERIAAYILPPASRPTLPPAAAPVPLFRAYNCDKQDTFLTSSITEAVNEHEVRVYKLEGCVGRVLPTAKPGTLPLYHLWSDVMDDHFYTTDIAERDRVRMVYSRDHGIEGYVYPARANGTIPLHRLLSQSRRDHFYTTSTTEKAIAINHLQYTDEGLVGYILPSLLTPEPVAFLRCFIPNWPDHFYATNAREMRRAVENGAVVEEDAGRIFPCEAPGTVPLFRLFANGDHFYTTDAMEHDRAANNGWKCEHIAGYVYPHQVSGSIPLHRLWSQASNDHMYTTSQTERDLATSLLGYVSEGVAAYVLPA